MRNNRVGATLVAHGEAEASLTRGVSCAVIYIAMHSNGLPEIMIGSLQAISASFEELPEPGRYSGACRSCFPLNARYIRPKSSGI